MNNVNIANCITSVRIIGTFLMMLTKPFSTPFFVIYSISGVSDVLDGFVARITKKVSDFGAKLDSISDLFFYFVMAIKIMPALIEKLPVQIWYAVAAVVFLRIISYLFVAVKYKRLASLHTKLNKITGFAVFLIPYMLILPFGVEYCIAACSVSAIATVHELFIHLSSKQYRGK